MSYDFAQLSRSFRELRTFVESDPELIAFSSAVRVLAQQASELESGNVDLPTMSSFAQGPAIPTEAHARRIIAIVSGIPNASHEMTMAERRALARILGNLVHCVTFDVMRRYSHLVANSRAGQ